MKQTKKILGMILAVVLVFTLCAPAAFAETDDPQPTPTETAEPTASPTPTPTPTPTSSPTPTPTSTPKPTASPTPTPTPSQSEEPTPSPSEGQDINLTLYVYTQDGQSADGYTVIIDKSSQTANKDGMVTFPGVTVETHNISVKDSSGKLSTGMLYLSRGNTTGITDQAMGGKYSISVGQDVTNVYLGVIYVPEEALQVYSAGTSKPNPPEAAATPTPAAGSFNITANFKDAEGKAVAGVAVTVTQSELPTPAVGVSDTSGKFVFNGAGFTTYAWTMLTQGAAEDSATVMNIEFRQGTQAKIAEETDGGYVVELPSAAKDLYMDFKQDASGRFVLDKVSDKAESGISSMLLGIIIMIVIIVVVVIIIVVVSRNRKKKKIYQAKQNEFRGREKDFEDPNVNVNGQESPKRTGGANKFDDRSRF